MIGLAAARLRSTSRLAFGLALATAGICVLSTAARAAPDQPTPTPTLTPSPAYTPPPTAPFPPLGDVTGARALWFVGIVAALSSLLWALPLLYDTWKANQWRTDKQFVLLEKMIAKAGHLSVEEIRQIVSAMDTQPRGSQGLTRSLLGLIISTFVGVALVATLVSTALDSSDLRKTIITAMLSILATVAGFYFGARTAQTSTEQATRPPASRAAGGNGGSSANGQNGAAETGTPESTGRGDSASDRQEG
jgi:hypothetical protein